MSFNSSPIDSGQQLWDIIQEHEYVGFNLSASGQQNTHQQQIIEPSPTNDRRRLLDGWKIIKERFPGYFLWFLVVCASCTTLRPHCHCGTCTSDCPKTRKEALKLAKQLKNAQDGRQIKIKHCAKNSGPGQQLSHCPLCVLISKKCEASSIQSPKNQSRQSKKAEGAQYPGISRSNIEGEIDLFCCASCQRFYKYWMKDAGEEKIKNSLKCEAREPQQKGNCVRTWQSKFNFVSKVHFYLLTNL